MDNINIQKVIEKKQKLKDIQNFSKEISAANYHIYCPIFLAVFLGIAISTWYFFEDLWLIFAVLGILLSGFSGLLAATVLCMGFSKDANYPLFNSFKATKKLKESKYKKDSRVVEAYKKAEKEYEEAISNLSHEDIAEFLSLIKKGEHIEFKKIIFAEVNKRNKDIDKKKKEENEINQYLDKIQEVSDSEDCLTQEEENSKEKIETKINSFKRKTYVKEELRIVTE